MLRSIVRSKLNWNLFWNGSHRTLGFGLGLLLATACSRNAFIKSTDPTPGPAVKTEAPTPSIEILETPQVLVEEQSIEPTCQNLIVSIDAYARPLELSEIEGLELPYIATEEHPIQIISLDDYSFDQIVYESPEGPVTVPRVKDSQVLFGLDLVLPPEQSVISLLSANLELDLMKYADDGYSDTELLCFLDDRICSGSKYTSPNGWAKNFNPDFWLGRGLRGTVPENSYFTERFKQYSVTDIPTNPEADFFQGQVSMEMASLLENTNTDVMSYLYSASPSFSEINLRSLPVMVADDTRVSRSLHSHMKVELLIDSCKITADQRDKLESTASVEVIEVQ